MKKKGTSIPRKAQQLLGDLKKLFPGWAMLLMLQLPAANVRPKKLAKWREDQLVSFITMLGLSAVDLEKAYREKRITKLAWAARNLLELSVWIDYCNLSDKHAKRFRDDMMRDLYGLSAAVQRSVEIESGAKDRTLDQKLAGLATLAQSSGIQGLEDDFERVSEAAKELGRQPVFSNANKLLSKFVHPTAWAIHTVTSVEADEGYRLIFLGDGVALAINSLIAVRKFIRGFYPQVGMTAKEAADFRKKLGREK
jgi:hypothetical protein